MEADRRLSTPSLGITYGIAQTVKVREVNAFQLPLSGSRSIVRCALLHLRTLTFNSLSRDHRARFRDFPALRGFLPRQLFAQMISKTAIWIYRFAPL